MRPSWRWPSTRPTRHGASTWLRAPRRGPNLPTSYNRHTSTKCMRKLRRRRPVCPSCVGRPSPNCRWVGCRKWQTTHCCPCGRSSSWRRLSFYCEWRLPSMGWLRSVHLATLAFRTFNRRPRVGTRYPVSGTSTLPLSAVQFWLEGMLGRRAAADAT